MARKEELEGRYFTGTLYFWGLTTLIIIMLPPAQAVAAIMISSLGDAAAAIIGKSLPHPRLPFNQRKNLAGSIAMLLVSILSTVITGLKPATIIVASTLSTIIEG